MYTCLYVVLETLQKSSQEKDEPTYLKTNTMS